MITIVFTGRKLTCSTSYQKEAKPTSDILSITFSPFEKGKREFSSSDSAGDLLGTYVQFNVPQRIRSGIKIREGSCFTLIASTLFARHKSLRHLSFGTLKGVLKHRDFNSVMKLQRRLQGLGWVHFRWSTERLPQLDEQSCMGYWEWGRVYYWINPKWFPRMQWISKSEGWSGTFFTPCIEIMIPTTFMNGYG
jgi:hypothetical protein